MELSQKERPVASNATNTSIPYLKVVRTFSLLSKSAFKLSRVPPFGYTFLNSYGFVFLWNSEIIYI